MNVNKVFLSNSWQGAKKLLLLYIDLVNIVHAKEFYVNVPLITPKHFIYGCTNNYNKWQAVRSKVPRAYYCAPIQQLISSHLLRSFSKVIVLKKLPNMNFILTAHYNYYCCCHWSTPLSLLEAIPRKVPWNF